MQAFCVMSARHGGGMLTLLRGDLEQLLQEQSTEGWTKLYTNLTDENAALGALHVAQCMSMLLVGHKSQ